MSAETKRCYRFYTLTDYEKEEQWLREMANKGWMLKSALPVVYTFEKMEPKDIVFKLDFQNTKIQPNDTYMQMIEDFGWTYLTSMNNYRYLYKEAAGNAAENEFYTDNESKYEMLKRIFKFRVLPILCIFLLLVIPNFIRVLDRSFESTTMDVIWTVLFVLYVWIFIKVGIGYQLLFKKYNPDRSR